MNAVPLENYIVLILVVKFFPTTAYPLIALFVVLAIVVPIFRKREAAAALKREKEHLEAVYNQYLHKQKEIHNKHNPETIAKRLTRPFYSLQKDLDDLDKEYKTDLERREVIRNTYVW
jgi:hypothetical protein